jgi:DNA-binding transcriptional regulator YiaG
MLYRALPFCHLQIKTLRRLYPNKWKSTQTCSKAPQTLTEHLRLYRLHHHLFQTDMAKLLAVDKVTIQNWERGVVEPMIRHAPRIIKLLGYDPETVPEALGLRIAYARRLLGFTQEDLGKALSIGTFAVWQWEAGLSIPPKAKLRQLQMLVEAQHMVVVTLQLF